MQDIDYTQMKWLDNGYKGVNTTRDVTIIRKLLYMSLGRPSQNKEISTKA